MARNKSAFQVIKDPVHGSMQFTHEEASWIMPFIDHENFQRLRHIKQAGLCDWFFPGAVHTRFNHSLGCCYVASQIANKIGLKPEQKQTVMIACLLHDIGHGPFSHVFEHVFHKKCVRHELWTPYFFKDFSSDEFLDKINRRSKDVPLNKSRFKLIERIIMHTEDKQKLLADIVSSQLDADRLDYLLRDSHFCGVNYGEYDFRWLLHCLTVVESGQEKRLGIIASGVGAVEHYLMARRLMTRNVYQMGKKFAAECMLIEFLKHLSQGLLEDERFAAVQHKTLAKFIIKVNAFNEKIRDSKDSDKLIKQFLKNNYDMYKQMYDHDVFSIIRSCAAMDFNHQAITLAKRLYQRCLPKAVPIYPQHIEKVREMVNSTKTKCRKQLLSWQLQVLSLPHQSYQADRDPILVEEESGRVRKLHDHSIVMHALSDQWESSHIISIDQEAIALPEVRKLIQRVRKL
jgi:uncharacterized protein